MASGFSSYLKTALLQHTAKLATYTAPTTVYYTLATSAFNASSVTGEFASGNYARIAVTQNSTNFGVSANVLTLLLDQAGVELNATQGAGSPTLSWAVFDAATGGNFLYGGDLASADQKTYAANDQIVVKATATTVTLT